MNQIVSTGIKYRIFVQQARSLNVLGVGKFNFLNSQNNFINNSFRHESTGTGGTRVVPYISEEQKFSFISDSPITETIENTLINLHELFAIDWAPTIILSAVAFRLLFCFPIKIYQEHMSARVANLQPIIKEKIDLKIKSLPVPKNFLTPEMKKKLNREVK